MVRGQGSTGLGALGLGNTGLGALGNTGLSGGLGLGSTGLGALGLGNTGLGALGSTGLAAHASAGGLAGAHSATDAYSGSLRSASHSPNQNGFSLTTKRRLNFMQ